MYMCVGDNTFLSGFPPLAVTRAIAQSMSAFRSPGFSLHATEQSPVHIVWHFRTPQTPAAVLPLSLRCAYPLVCFAALKLESSLLEAAYRGCYYAL